MDATFSMAQGSVPSVVLAMLGCMVAMLECICMLASMRCSIIGNNKVSECLYVSASAMRLCVYYEQCCM